MTDGSERAKGADEGVRAPSGYQTEQAVSAWQRMIADPEFIEDENHIALSLAKAKAEDARDLLARWIDAAVWLERRCDEAKQLKTEYDARRARYERWLADARETIEQLMVAISVTKHQAKLASASIQAAPPALVVDDEGLIPDEYFQSVRTLKRSALKDDLLHQGIIVDGAHLNSDGTMLVLRKIR